MRWLMTVVAVLALAGCSADHPSAATIDVDHPVALFDQAVRVRVSGLKPHAKAVLSSTAANGSGQKWRGTATVTADGAGAIDLDTAVPSAGSYSGADGMGLFWSMTGDGEFVLGAGTRSYSVHLAVSTGGREVGSRDVVRELIAPGVTVAALTVAADAAGEGDQAGPGARVPAGRARRGDRAGTYRPRPPPTARPTSRRELTVG